MKKRLRGSLLESAGRKKSRPESEFFKHLEVGWVGSWENRFSDNVHLSAWQVVDKRTRAGANDDWRLAFSASHLSEDRWMPLFRAGRTEGGGAVVDRSVSAELG